MRLADCPQQTESVGHDASDGPRIQPQHESVATHHHFIPPTWERFYNGDDYNSQSWRQANPSRWPYQDEEYGRTCEHRYQSQQQYYEPTHEQPYRRHREQCSPHHVFDISQNQPSFSGPRHPSRTLANSPSAAPEYVPESERPSGQSYNW